jgi:hypothetical protein
VLRDGCDDFMTMSKAGAGSMFQGDVEFALWRRRKQGWLSKWTTICVDIDSRISMNLTIATERFRRFIKYNLGYFQSCLSSALANCQGWYNWYSNCEDNTSFEQ